MSTYPYKSLKLKTINVKKLVEGDIILFGNGASGALHRVVKMYGVKNCKKSTRLMFKVNFYAIIRNGVVLVDDNDPGYTINMSPYISSTRQVMNNIPSIITV